MAGFLTGFATGALRAANTRFDEVRTAEYEKDKMNAQLVSTLAMQQAAEWPKLVDAERTKLNQYTALASMYGPETANFAMQTGETNLENLSRIKTTGTGAGAPDYAKMAQDRINTLRTNTLGTIRTALGDQYNEELTNQLIPEVNLGGAAPAPSLQYQAETSATGSNLVSMQNSIKQGLLGIMTIPKEAVTITTDPFTDQVTPMFHDQNAGYLYGKFMGIAGDLLQDAIAKNPGAPVSTIYLPVLEALSDMYRANQEKALNMAPDRSLNAAMGIMANWTKEEMYQNYSAYMSKRGQGPAAAPGTSGPRPGDFSAPESPTDGVTSPTAAPIDPNELQLQQSLLAEEINNLGAGIDGNTVYQIIFDRAVEVFTKNGDPDPVAAAHRLLQEETGESMLEYYNKLMAQ